MAMTTEPAAHPAPHHEEVPAKALRRDNTVMGVLHLVQALAVLALTNAFALPVTATYLGGPPGPVPEDQVQLFEIRTGWAVAAFLLLSSLAHFVLAGPAFGGYIRRLREGRNDARWIEYSLSSTIMIVVIAQLTGIADIVALLAIAGCNVSMILFGLLQERYEQPGGSLLAFWLGCIAGIVPWIAVAIYAAAPGATSDVDVPAFVFAIIVSLFVFFNVFAVNMWLQYRQVGKWRRYVFGERAYIVLSLVAKSLLAWQIFAGTLTG
jgi:hypothetical protein